MLLRQNWLTSSHCSGHWPLLRHASLLAAFIGCQILAAAYAAGSNGGPDEGTPEEDVPITPARKAYYNLGTRELSEPGWPTKYTDYGVFVCQATFSSEKLARIRTEIPGAICLAPTDARNVKIDVFEHPYWKALSARFDSTLCVRDLNTGQIVRVYSNPDRPGAPEIPTFVLRKESADVLVDFHREVTMKTDWDGIYIDNLGIWPKWWKERLESITTNYDIDNDGIADTLEDIDQTYAQWRPYFTEQLRRAIGDHTILIGNVGGRLLDPSLNGITIEKVGERVALSVSRWYFMLHQLYTNHRPLSIAWVYSSPGAAPAAQLTEELDWLYYGDVIID